MRRVSITLPDDAYRALEELVSKTGISNRSRIMADAVMLLRGQELEDNRFYAGSLVLIYDHSKGETVYAVTDAQHDFNDIVRGTTHIHLSEEKCVEITTVVGEGKRIKELVSRLRKVSGVITVQTCFVVP
ncbi:CopG family ribbon-helix-helix protein [Infirmifilum uzonense]|uniref:CopG family ribbon-helix-helix protein n=1 Tax=Infirmifilum uzonense TaxID=1550241 RepID=UPI0030841B59